ncbi:non-ribosomal peptide synthetase [Spirosoma utsteinense]|uniref:Amino acid adenylation domain-containing protein n=1 Tax=Spirosoma utsteinense TaxID=2585773 RepID=A0ABR6VZP7_9BACT|nr:non-ribosomal peptide synthetase [Spirosoma utsteinense]MBC3786886.1 amino acid adenylation domain-containing protein [Spirosoma utsteinense]MBC3789817.1 amino acid adenylation domain-containing protein [Spirosoma utsteinense]
MVDTTTHMNFVAVDFDPFAGPAILRLATATEPQLEILTACLLGGDDASRAYNESISLRFTGALNKPALQQAWRALVDRHEMLRSAFSTDGSQVIIFRDGPAEMNWLDCSDKTEVEQATIVADHTKQDALHLFDLQTGPLVRIGLIKLAEQTHHLTITAHHIVCDGWSLGILMQDLSALYSAYAQHLTPSLPEAPLFSQHAADQQTFATSETYREIERYWIDQYRQNVPVLNLPTDFPRPALRTYKSNRRDYPLDEALVLAVKAMGVKAGCSFVTTLLASFEVLLHRLTGQEDIVLGLPAAGQSATGNYRLVGHCVNLLPLRSFPKRTLRFIDFLKQRKEAVLDAFEYQQLTFGSLLKKIKVARDPSRVALVPVIFNVDMGLVDDVNFYGLDYTFISNPRQYESVDLFLNAGGSEKALMLEWSYNTQLFSETTIDRMMAEFEGLLRAVVADPTIQLDQIPLTPEPEKETVIAEWNKTQAEYPRHTPLHQLLTQTAAEYPQKTALIVNQDRMSFKTLDETSSQVAHCLQRSGVQVGDMVGVMLDRSTDLLVTLLAVLKAGAAYVPIDPDYPHDRIAYMLTNSAARLVITSKKYAGRLAHSAPEWLIEQTLTELELYPATPPATTVTGQDLAYILYTSGSTGQPKGVMIEHHSLVNLLYSMIDWPGIDHSDVLLGVTTVSFDIAGLELFLPLLTGATLVLADAAMARDGRALLQRLSDRTVAEESITIIQATPATYKMLLAADWQTRLPLRILCCGEPMSNELARQLIPRCATLWNMYGPTETTIYSTGTQITDGDKLITIGRPINNTQVYIVDEQLNPVRKGAVGEIYIAGDGVARGYKNQQELTAERFVPNPFDTGNGLMYRTGDLGQFTETGEIHCLGRIDQQVKIRGYRIELGEIENTLSQLSDINEAVVVAREDRPGDQRLVAYIVVDADRLPAYAPESTGQPGAAYAVSPEQARIWKKQAGTSLPDYMVPAEFLLLSQLPLTPNGKIDRKALPKPVQATPADPAQLLRPETKEEELLLSIWRDILGRESISVLDDFFELGGHSLIAVRVMTRLEKATGRRLPLSTLFEYPTIRKLASLLQDDKPATVFKSLVPIRPQGRKVPIYIIHGIGLNLLNFKSLVDNMDIEQPIYGLQARGLDGVEEPLDSIEAIAGCYIDEVLIQNPAGPYAIAGYSFGGYVALEMARQLKKMGKDVKMLAMFDTNAEESMTHYSVIKKLGIKASRQLPKFMWIMRSFAKEPSATVRYQRSYVKWKLGSLRSRVAGVPEPKTEAGPDHMDRIIEKHEIAYNNYRLKPYDGTIDLFKAEVRRYFVDDPNYLGWKKYARKGVRVHDVPGDHKQMMLPPNDRHFARALQAALDTNVGL